MTTIEWNAWIKFKGGQALWDELSSGFGLKCLPCGATGTQMAGWFNKLIETADDLKGLKMRIPGLGGDVMAKLGASPVSLPGGQIYENLVSGAIDATEWVGPYNDYFMKFYEAAKYYYYPGFHEPGGGVSLGMNAKWWADLTDHERAIITAASMEEHAAQYEEAQANNGAFLARSGERPWSAGQAAFRGDLRKLRRSLPRRFTKRPGNTASWRRRCTTHFMSHASRGRWLAEHCGNCIQSIIATACWTSRSKKPEPASGIRRKRDGAQSSPVPSFGCASATEVIDYHHMSAAPVFSPVYHRRTSATVVRLFGWGCDGGPRCIPAQQLPEYRARLAGGISPLFGSARRRAMSRGRRPVSTRRRSVGSGQFSVFFFKQRDLRTDALVISNFNTPT